MHIKVYLCLWNLSRSPYQDRNVFLSFSFTDRWFLFVFFFSSSLHKNPSFMQRPPIQLYLEWARGRVSHSLPGFWVPGSLGQRWPMILAYRSGFFFIYDCWQFLFKSLVMLLKECVLQLSSFYMCKKLKWPVQVYTRNSRNVTSPYSLLSVMLVYLETEFLFVRLFVLSKQFQLGLKRLHFGSDICLNHENLCTSLLGSDSG